MKRLLVALAFVASLAGLERANAQTSTPSVTYAAGWNMAGGPPGTNLSAASALFAWSSGQYVAVTTPTTQLCEGYWAYFTQPATIALSTSAGPTQVCPLQAGWNLVGNPFSGPALLPAGTVAWYWDPARGTYQNVTVIPAGGAVWIYADSASSVTLAAPPPPMSLPPPPTVEIDFLPAGPLTVHVGSTIKLNLPLVPLERATYDPAFLHLDAAGESGDLTCLNDPSCAISLINQFWLWHATTPGTTSIMVAPVCVSSSTCATPASTIVVTILP